MAFGDDPAHEIRMALGVLAEHEEAGPGVVRGEQVEHRVGVARMRPVVEGQVERATVGAGESKSECLVQTPKWDFNWQRTYAYDAPVESLPKLRGGDVVTFRCTYDNTLQNPFVAQALKEKGLSQPVDVYLGEQTLDEMCIGLLPVLIPMK